MESNARIARAAGHIAGLAALLLCMNGYARQAESGTLTAETATEAGARLEAVPFGNFEQWATREITESSIIGGNVRTIYTIGPNETIKGNVPYDFSKTIWGNSNAFAKVAGIVKTSLTVEPDKGPDGLCCKLSTAFASCKVLGVVDIKVLAAGTIFWGKVIEPITGVNEPYSFMDWGIPFTKRPKAVVLDYKSIIPNTGKLVKGTSFRSTYFDGEDPAAVVLILQRRTEDENGVVHSLRVGTACLMISKTSDGWQPRTRIPVIYGDASKSASFVPNMGLIKGENSLYTINSRGKKSRIVEDGWADPDAVPTHAILIISSGSHSAFIGALDNTLWVDNIMLEY